jgi:hypothetical protein
VVVLVHSHRTDVAAPRGDETVRAFCVQIGQKGAVWSLREAQQAIDLMVGVAGFEPATPASRTQCSTGLSHTPTRTRLIALGFAHRKKPNLRI